MREYETTFIVQPEISDDGSQAILSKLDGVLEAGSSTRLMCEDGKRKLGYEIRKFHKGHYYTLQFDDGAVVPDVERALRLEESVFRFLTILVTEEVEDIDARKAVAAEAEVEQEKRAAERAQREAEEAAARREQEEAERQAAAGAAAAAAAEAAAGPPRPPAEEAVAEEAAAPAEEAPVAEEAAAPAEEAATDATGDAGDEETKS